jgi:UPF0271 protein
MTQNPSIDFNADMGESFGLFRYGADEELLPLLSSANIACGFHAGDPSVMRRTVALAKQHGVEVGAHVGFPDLLGFGRRRLMASPTEVRDYTTYQIGALQAFLAAEGMALHHVKPHGALYMMALEDDGIAQAIAEASAAAGRTLQIYTIQGSAMDRAATARGLQVVPEFFADRGYHADGAVKMFGWTLEEASGTPEAIAARVVHMIQRGIVAAIGGGETRVTAKTVCVHSDTPGAPAIAKAVRQALAAAKIEVRKADASGALVGAEPPGVPQVKKK